MADHASLVRKNLKDPVLANLSQVVARCLDAEVHQISDALLSMFPGCRVVVCASSALVAVEQLVAVVEDSELTHSFAENCAEVVLETDVNAAHHMLVYMRTGSSLQGVSSA
jgi:hypothetical protein